MGKKKDKEREVVETETHPIILRIPKTAFKLDVTAYMPDNAGEKIITIHRIVEPKELSACRDDFVELVGDDDYDAVYHLTDEYKKYLDLKPIQSFPELR